MTKAQLQKHLNFIYRDLTLAQARMHKVATKLGIEENTQIKAIIQEVEQLIKIGEEK